MSRIGRKPVLIPQGVTVAVENSVAKVTGPKGTLTVTVRPEIAIKIEGNTMNFEVVKESRSSSAHLGTTRSLLNNMVTGVSTGFEKKLELVGVGYRAKMQGADTLQLTVGFSHPVDFKLPAAVQCEVADNTNVVLKSFDKHLLGQIAANIRKIRKPEPYKGKGIKYAGETIRRKQGKSGKA